MIESTFLRDLCEEKCGFESLIPCFKDNLRKALQTQEITYFQGFAGLFRAFWGFSFGKIFPKNEGFFSKFLA